VGFYLCMACSPGTLLAFFLAPVSRGPMGQRNGIELQLVQQIAKHVLRGIPTASLASVRRPPLRDR